MLRVLMTLEAMGGIWRYALDAAAMMERQGVACRLLGFGPPPAAVPHGVDIVWTDQPLDWMVSEEAALQGVAPTIAGAAWAWQASVVHISAASQAAKLPDGLAVIVQSHSCVPTWWAALRGGDLPDEWHWQIERNRTGLRRASSVVVPSASHGSALAQVYGAIPHLRVVPNAAASTMKNPVERQPYVFAAGRWWDDGKNGRVLDDAARQSPWPILMAGALHGPNGASLSVHNAVSLGQLTSAQTLLHMAQAAIFAAPSRYEPFGLAVLEAANAGACLVLADIATFRELWGGVAVFVDPADPAAWGQAITALAADPLRRAELGGHARRRAADFTFDHQIAGLLAAYDAAGPAVSQPVAEFV